MFAMGLPVSQPLRQRTCCESASLSSSGGVKGGSGKSWAKSLRLCSHPLGSDWKVPEQISLNSKSVAFRLTPTRFPTSTGLYTIIYYTQTKPTSSKIMLLWVGLVFLLRKSKKRLRRVLNRSEPLLLPPLVPSLYSSNMKLRGLPRINKKRSWVPLYPARRFSPRNRHPSPGPTGLVRTDFLHFLLRVLHRIFWRGRYGFTRKPEIIAQI